MLAIISLAIIACGGTAGSEPARSTGGAAGMLGASGGVDPGGAGAGPFGGIHSGGTANDAGAGAGNAGAGDAGGDAGAGNAGAGDAGAGGQAVAANRIVVGTTGVAFSALPERSVLRRSVVVYSSLGRTDINWSATSDQAWLTVSRNGKTGQAISLIANPASLAPGNTYFASVQVAALDPTVENQETIRVGLYVSDRPAQNLSVNPTSGSLSLAASAVEPIVFVTDGGPDVTGYSVFTGEAVRVLSAVVTDGGALTLSGDGRSLFVLDRKNSLVQKVDATSGALGQAYPAPHGDPGSGLLYFRPDAFATLVVPSTAIYDVATAQPFANSSVKAGYSLAASGEGNLIVNDGGSVYRVTRTGEHGATLVAQNLFTTGTAGGRRGQACLTPDGQTVYTASGSPYNFPEVSVSTQTTVRLLPGLAYPNSVLCAWNNLVIGGIDGYYETNDIWIYDGPSGLNLGQMSSSTATINRSLVDRGLAISGDGSRLISLSMSSPGANVGNEIRFQSLPAPRE